MLIHDNQNVALLVVLFESNLSVEALSKSIHKSLLKVFILNILPFEFPNILSFFCLAFLMNLSVFSLINYVFRMTHLFIFPKLYTLIVTLTVNAVVDNFLWSLVGY